MSDPIIVDLCEDEQEIAEFVLILLDQLAPRLANRIELLNLGGGSISELMDRQREQFQEMALLFAGLPPHHQARMARRLAPQWRTLTELTERNRALARRRANA
jgi:hypothetical protein